MTRNSAGSSSGRNLLNFDDIPDQWRKIDDIPPIEEMIHRLQSDPIFADAFFFQETNDEANAADGTYQPLVDYQGHCFEQFDKNFVTWMQACRGAGKSSTLARWVVAYCLRFPGTKVGIFAPSFRQSKQFYQYCIDYLRSNSNVDSHVYKLETELAAEPTFGQEPIIRFKNGSTIEPLPSGDGAKLRGRRFNIIIIDEAYQLQREFHDSHIMPMGNVKLGGRRTKTFYLTTSWYTEVFAFSILQNILRQIIRGREGYCFIDVELEDVLKSGFPFDKAHILHELESMSDDVTGKLSDDALMTFFNKWIKTGASFYTAGMIAECQQPQVEVWDKKPEKIDTTLVLGVDPATVGENKTAMSVCSCPGSDERYLRAIHQWKHLKPEEIAGNIHKMVDLYGMQTIVLDKSGGLGKIVADLCTKDNQLIDGEWQKRTPITVWDHPNARMARAHIVLTLPSDERMKVGVIGPRVDSSINSGGEADLKNVLHLSMRRVMQNGKFFAPKMLKDEDYYTSNRGEIMDNIVEALSQFPKIDRKKGPDGKTPITDTRGNFTFTRPAQDDGAYSVVYANYAANIHYRMLEGKWNRDEIPAIWNKSPDDNYFKEQTHTVILPRL